MNPDVQRLEAERLRPMPPDLVPLDELFRRLLDLIADECWKAGYLPARFRKGITEGRKP